LFWMVRYSILLDLGAVVAVVTLVRLGAPPIR
jgi:hypothetical protein